MLARCVRVASASARVVSTHSRALYSTDPIDSIDPPQPPLPAHEGLQSIITALNSAQPPIGNEYPPPKGPPGPKNPLDKNLLRSFVHTMPRYSLYCQSTRNNTITTLMDDQFHPVASLTGGSCGFKKVNRSSYEAGYQCAVGMFKQIEKLAEKKTFEVDLYFKGFGQGRDAMHRALLTSEGDKVRPLIASITDRTPIKIGGTRAKKARRL